MTARDKRDHAAGVKGALARVRSLSERERMILRNDTNAPTAKYKPGPKGKRRLT